MKIYILLSAVVLVAGCTNPSVESDRAYYTPLLEKFKLGMSFGDVKNVIEKYDHNFKLYNLCNKQFEKNITNCEQGYSSIGVIPLPSKNFILGKGQVQVYFTFDGSKVLKEKFHEVYYANHHK